MTPSFPSFTCCEQMAATHCRHLVFLDFAHLKGVLEAGVCSASTVDADNHIIILAIFICRVCVRSPA